MTCRTMARVMLPHSNLIAQWKHSPVHGAACRPASNAAQQCSMLYDTQLEVLAWRMQISWWTQPLSRCKALSAINTAMSLR